MKLTAQQVQEMMRESACVHALREKPHAVWLDPSEG
jgi:hypothetical protein